MNESDVLRARKKVVLEIADAVEGMIQKKYGSSVWLDNEELCSWIDAFIPLTHVEAEARFDELPNSEEVPQKPTKPNIMDDLRAALGYDKKMGLVQCVRGAIDFIEGHKK